MSRLPREILVFGVSEWPQAFRRADYPWLVAVRVLVKAGDAGWPNGRLGEDGHVMLELYGSDDDAVNHSGLRWELGDQPDGTIGPAIPVGFGDTIVTQGGGGAGDRSGMTTGSGGGGFRWPND